jgi:hypothetical protein
MFPGVGGQIHRTAIRRKMPVMPIAKPGQSVNAEDRKKALLF